MRVTKAIRDDLLYKTKKVQYEQNEDSANIAAQRSYTDTQISMNKNISQIFLKNYESMMEMMKTGGDIEVGAAERGVSGANIAKALLVNRAKLGLVEANRSRFLMNATYDMNRANESTQIKLKDVLNKEFSSVALQPVRDIPDPPPVLGNPGLTFALGAASAVASGFGEGEFGGNTDWQSDFASDMPDYSNAFDTEFDMGGFDWSADYSFTNDWMN